MDRRLVQTLLHQAHWKMDRRLVQTLLHQAPNDTIDLKKCLIDTWASIPQCVVDEAIDQWTARLCACVKAKGRQFEHLLQ